MWPGSVFVPSKTFFRYRTSQKNQIVPGKRFKWYGITHHPYLFNARGGQNIGRQKKGDSYFYEPPDNYYEGNLLKVIHFLEIILLAAYYDILEFLLACAGWNEVTADDILFQTFEVIDAGADSGLAEDLGSLLE